MKIAGYILAFYLILLAAVPCCAFDDCPDDKVETTANHEKGDEDCGSCSPFFSCEGCATVSIAYEIVPLEINALKVSPTYTIYIQEQLPTADHDFWQPPKLG
jgi:hypothetical protein